jgi:hypothetical protein
MCPLWQPGGYTLGRPSLYYVFVLSRLARVLARGPRDF